MDNQWKQLRTERQASGAREIERLPAAAALGFKVDINIKNLGHFQGSVIDFNAKSLAIDITALAGIGQLESQIEAITVTHGTRDIRSIEKPRVSIRQEEGQWRLVVLLNQMERKAAERRHTRIKTRENFKPFLWVSDPHHLSRIINFQVENFSADGMQLRTSLSNKHNSDMRKNYSFTMQCFFKRQTFGFWLSFSIDQQTGARDARSVRHPWR